MVKLRKRYEAGVQDRNDRGIQLIERNEEVCIFYEKINIHGKKNLKYTLYTLCCLYIHCYIYMINSCMGMNIEYIHCTYIVCSII